MTDIDSNITFENGKIAKCVLKIAGGKTFTVTLGNRGYEVIEGGNVTASSAASPSTPGSAPGSAATPGSASGSAPGSASTSAPSQQKNEYNTQKDLIEKLGPHGYKSLVK